MSADPALGEYLAEAASWDADRRAIAERSVAIAWRVASVAVVLLAVSLVTLALLVPLKRVEPFIIRVDNSTGIVDVVPVYAGNAPMPETVTRYFLEHYVTVCERFNFATAESDYEECGAFHGAVRNQAWYAQWDRSNPASPLNRYQDGTSVRAEVTAVSFFKRGSGIEDLAQIRYVKSTRAGGTGNETQTHWIATLQYAYGEPSKDPRVRRWNPLGFKVVEFQAEPEVLPAPAAAPGTAGGAERSSLPGSGP